MFPNQTRSDIQVYGGGETTPGGKALKFHCTIRVRLSKSETTKEKVEDPFLGTNQAEAVEQVVQFHVVKNKTAPPFRRAGVRLRYGHGFLDKETLLDLAVRRKIVKLAGGGNYELPGGKKLRGTENVLEFYRENPADYDKLRMAMRNSQPASDETVPVEPDSDAEVTEETEGLAEGKVKL